MKWKIENNNNNNGKKLCIYGCSILLASLHHAYSIITSTELTALKPTLHIVSQVCLHVFLSLSLTCDSTGFQQVICLSNLKMKTRHYNYSLSEHILCFKVIAHLKMKMFWSFAHPYDILNLYDFLSSVRHDRLWELMLPSFKNNVIKKQQNAHIWVISLNYTYLQSIIIIYLFEISLWVVQPSMIAKTECWRNES